MKDLYSDFIQKLKKLFGKFDEDLKRFEKASNSEIARELGYSDAQFSRLINESATVGEYQRAIKNTDRILTINQLQDDLEKSGKRVVVKANPLWLILSVALGICVVGLMVFLLMGNDKAHDPVSIQRDYMLKWAFETSFINPYVKLDDLPDDCDYPCYKYQGKWELNKPYKIPFFRERNGFHYLATEVNMYARCMAEQDDSGKIFEGLEYQKHEIWYDQRELPIDSFISESNSRLNESYQNLNFSKDKNFTKVATVHTFFRNEFEIDSAYIYRTGKVIGRDLEFAPSEKLQEKFSSDGKIIQDIENELNRIASNRLKDFSKPISCGHAAVPNINYHLVKDGDVMSFDCQLTTSRVPMNYTKTYVLVNQYIKNNCYYRSPVNKEDTPF